MTSKKLSYGDYLELDKILDSQTLKSEQNGNMVHDEMLFIIIHQTYELWFKQILHELDSIIEMFKGNYVEEENAGIVVSRLGRIIEIQKLLIDQVSILETMTPMDFLEFRNLLSPASGFQSIQFRKIENKLGMEADKRVRFGKQRYDEYLSKNDRNEALKSEGSSSLFMLLEDWLERTPFLQFEEFNFWESYKLAVEKMINDDINLINKNTSLDETARDASLKNYDVIKNTYEALFDENKYQKLLDDGHRRLSQKATLGALFIKLYRDEPVLQLPHRLLTQLVDIDQLLTSWRYRHSLLVFRMIGVKIGTGGSAGHGYLKKTAEKHSIFRDISNLSTYIIPRSALPKLPRKLKKELGFYYIHGK
jgi:tryptophan 2,3-dioxygenase